MSRSLIAALTALTAFTGCSDKGATDTADTEETAAPAMINLTVELDDIVGGADLSAATASLQGEALTRNSDGTFSGTAPQSTLLTAATGSPYSLSAHFACFSSAAWASISPNSSRVLWATARAKVMSCCLLLNVHPSALPSHF